VKIDQFQAQADAQETLTKRQFQIAAMVADGLSEPHTAWRNGSGWRGCTRCVTWTRVWGAKRGA